MASQLWQRLRAARKFADLTQAQLGVACGITRSGYAFFETSDDNSRTRPNTDQIIAISKLTRVPVEWLLNDTNDPGDVWKVGTVAGVSYQDSTLSRQQRQSPLLPMTVRSGSGSFIYPNGDRMEETFWRAVEYNVMMANPDMSASFDVPVDIMSIGVRVRFMDDKTLACFTSRSDDQTILFYIGRLLLIERATGTGHKKHLIVWSREADPGLSTIIATARNMFAVEVKPVTTAEEAAAYLLSLE